MPDAPGSGRSSLSSNSSSTSSSDDVAPQQPALLPRSPLLAEAAQISAATDAAAAEYTEGRQQLAAAAAVVRQAMQLPQHCLHFLRPGRIVRVTEGGSECVEISLCERWNRPPQHSLRFCGRGASCG